MFSNCLCPIGLCGIVEGPDCASRDTSLFLRLSRDGSRLWADQLARTTGSGHRCSESDRFPNRLSEMSASARGLWIRRVLVHLRWPTSLLPFSSGSATANQLDRRIPRIQHHGAGMRMSDGWRRPEGLAQSLRAALSALALVGACSGGDRGSREGAWEFRVDTVRSDSDGGIRSTTWLRAVGKRVREARRRPGQSFSVSTACRGTRAARS